MGICSGPLMAIGVNSVTINKAGIASSIINSSRMLGATFGIAVFGTIFKIVNNSYKIEITLLSGIILQVIFILYCIKVYYINKKVN